MLDRKFGFVVSCLSLALSACGGGGEADSASIDVAPNSTSRPATATPVDASGATPQPTPVIVQPPTIPSAQATGQVTLRWNASPEADISGYRVYYGTSQDSYAQPEGAGLNVGLSTSAQVQGLTKGQTYYFTVTAYDRAGNESNYSAVVAKFVQ